MEAGFLPIPYAVCLPRTPLLPPSSWQSLIHSSRPRLTIPVGHVFPMWSTFLFQTKIVSSLISIATWTWFHPSSQQFSHWFPRAALGHCVWNETFKSLQGRNSVLFDLFWFIFLASTPVSDTELVFKKRDWMRESKRKYVIHLAHA